MARTKKGKNSASAPRKQKKKYAVGTLLAVDPYGHGNFFEARVKSTNKTNDVDRKGMQYVKLEYLDQDGSTQEIDLNKTPLVELTEDNVIVLNDTTSNLDESENGFLGRRLTVQWEDGQRYSGTITKSLKSKKSFVYISYDDGDKVWYDLAPEDKKEQPKGSVANRKVKKEHSDNEQNESKTGAKKGTTQEDAPISGFEAARMEIVKKFPVGSIIAVDSYRDEHYHEATLQKYQRNPTKADLTHGRQWAFLSYWDTAKSKQWVDLNIIKAIPIIPEEILTLHTTEVDDDKGFLGKRIIVQWKDGNKYCGLATKCLRNNKHFVFLEYDDGDQCWCDLRREAEWSIDGEEDSDEESGTNRVEEGESRKRKESGETKIPSTKRRKHSE
jgi:hypothetical protein